MPLRISFPCGVILRRSFIVKMYCGATRPPVETVIVSQRSLHGGGNPVRWMRDPGAAALLAARAADRESPLLAVGGRMAGQALGTVAGRHRRPPHRAPRGDPGARP